MNMKCEQQKKFFPRDMRGTQGQYSQKKHIIKDNVNPLISDYKMKHPAGYVQEKIDLYEERELSPTERIKYRRQKLHGAHKDLLGKTTEYMRLEHDILLGKSALKDKNDYLQEVQETILNLTPTHSEKIRKNYDEWLKAAHQDVEKQKDQLTVLRKSRDKTQIEMDQLRKIVNYYEKSLEHVLKDPEGDDQLETITRDDVIKALNTLSKDIKGTYFKRPHTMSQAETTALRKHYYKQFVTKNMHKLQDAMSAFFETDKQGDFALKDNHPIGGKLEIHPLLFDAFIDAKREGNSNLASIRAALNALFTRSEW